MTCFPNGETFTPCRTCTGTLRAPTEHTRQPLVRRLGSAPQLCPGSSFCGDARHALSGLQMGFKFSPGFTYFRISSLLTSFSQTYPPEPVLPCQRAPRFTTACTLGRTKPCTSFFPCLQLRSTSRGEGHATGPGANRLCKNSAKCTRPESTYTLAPNYEKDLLN